VLAPESICATPPLESGVGDGAAATTCVDAFEDTALMELANLFGACTNTVLPLPLPPRPVKSPSVSPRLRQRHARRLKVWKVAVRLILLINSMSSGSAEQVRLSSAPLRGFGDARALAAQKDIVGRLLCEAARFANCRRHFVTGGSQQQHVTSLVKSSVEVDGYVCIARGHAQVPLMADSIAEPNHDERIILLEALPATEAHFYSSEENAIDWIGKSAVILEEITSQYGFVGGSHFEYLRYFHRSDLPPSMWRWHLFSDVKAIWGFLNCVKKGWYLPTQDTHGVWVQLSLIRYSFAL
jgi:hypothetical protein